MIITNTDNVPGRRIAQILGIVQGNVMGAKLAGEQLLSSIKKALVATLSWGPKIITGDDIGLPQEAEKEGREEAKSQQQDSALEEYAALLYQLRERALARLAEEAQKKGADAVVNVKFGVNVIVMHAFEVYAYGTAVKLEGMRAGYQRKAR